MKKVILTILDGYGLSDETVGNAPKLANTKTLNHIFRDFPNTTISASGISVGLPDKQMGNSEVGHMNIGAGRIIYQDLTRINKDINDKTFLKKQELINTLKYAKASNKPIHLLGLLSDGGVHSHIKHLFAILDFLKQENFSNVYVHPILDGRDTSPTSGINFLKELDNKLRELDFPKIGTVIGRFYAMDRDKRYERIAEAFNLFTGGKGIKTDNLFNTISDYYKDNITDEFMKPILFNVDSLIKKDDAVIFFNFRPDRAREITRKFVESDLNLYYTCMSEYDKTIKNVHIIYPPEEIRNTIGEVVSNHNLKQLRIAETEKYAHVTFFLNGGREKEFKGEDRILVPSPKDVPTYDLKPEMSAKEVCQKVVEALDKDYYDLIVLNFANPDMVGHTGNLKAVIKALEVLDQCMEKILNKVLEKDYAMIVTADHGNCECMINPDGSINTAHTTNLVPLSLINYKDCKLNSGKLANISPTILDILDIKKPVEMEEDSLIVK